MQIMNTYFILYSSIFCITTASDTIISDGVVAIENQAVDIPCPASAQIHIRSKIPTLVRWFHNRFYKPIYSLDLRFVSNKFFINWTMTQGQHFPSNEFDGRLYLDLHRNPIALRIDPVLYDDHGRYTCRIDFKTHRSRISVQDLKVIVPPKGIIIRDKSGNKVNTIAGPYHLGEELHLFCDAVGGHPLPNISWIGERTINTTFQVYGNTSFLRSDLLIPTLNKFHQGNKFSCRAWNNNVTTPVISIVTLDLIIPPTNILMKSNFKQPLIAGSTLQLTCTCNGSHPKASIQWFINETYDASPRTIIKNKGSVTISFFHRLISEEDNGLKVKCVATNPNILNYTLEEECVLNVIYKPHVTVKIIRSIQKSSGENSSVVLLCDVNANPTINEKKWFLDGQPIENSPTIFQKNGSLHLMHIKRTHLGTYTCSAKNDVGSNNSSVRVDIKHSPVCREIEISRQYGESLQDKIVANVTCNLLSNPENVTFYWMIRNSSTNHSWSTGQVPHTIVKGKNTSFKITCWGKNDIGEQKEPCTYTFLKENRDSNFDVVLIAGFAATLSIVIIFVLTRKVQQNKPNYLINERELKYFDGTGIQKLNKTAFNEVNDVNTTDSDSSSGKLISQEDQL
nr:nephrin [Parasteatoda tepidariorum]